MKRGRRLGERGIAAVEFALVMPVLLILFIGTVEVALLYRTAGKLNEFTGNFVQMVSLQHPAANTTAVLSGSAGELGDICTGATYGLQPFSPNGVTAAVASLTEISASPLRYDYWEADSSCPNKAAALGSTAVCALAVHGSGGSMFANLDDNVLIVRATLAYPGTAGLFIGNAPTLAQTAFSRWRYASTLQTPAELVCTGPDCTTASTITC